APVRPTERGGDLPGLPASGLPAVRSVVRARVAVRGEKPEVQAPLRSRSGGAVRPAAVRPRALRLRGAPRSARAFLHRARTCLAGGILDQRRAGSRPEPGVPAPRAARLVRSRLRRSG